MTTNLWNDCVGQNHIVELQETAWRMIEAQHILATRKLVDSANEQEILEEMIESAKPQTFGKEFTGLHVLLYTPFRYPPLRYGSRFGTRTERSLWYGSLDFSTVLAEKAFYQFLFLRASLAQFGNVLRTFTAFSVQIKTFQGVNLHQEPFTAHANVISSPTHYTTSQSLGTAMRQHKVEAFCYKSARDPGKGTNVALFAPNAFLHKKPQPGSFQTWQSLSNEMSVEFIRTSALANEYKIFSLEAFLVDGNLLTPVN